MKDICLLSNPLPLASSRYGGKIRNLHLLYHEGYSVPDGICIPTEVYKDALINLGLSRHIDNLDSLSPTELEDFRRTIFLKVNSEATIFSKWKVQIQEHLDFLSSSYDLFAVRSSATLEDGPNFAFPGRFASYLAVKPSDLEEFIRQCWASLWTPQVINYLRVHNLNISRLSMAVLLQGHIDSSWAGVAFTNSPTSLSDDDILIEVGQGLGPGVVQGEVQQIYHARFARADLDQPAEMPKSFESVTAVQATEESGILELKIVDYISPPIEILSTLAKVAVSIESLFSVPQDIEWAIDATNNLWILQSRSITARGIEAFEHSTVIKIDSSSQDRIPVLAGSHDKVTIRLLADRHNITIGAGWLIAVVDGATPKLPEELLECEQISFVLILPRLFQGKTLRAFSSKFDRLITLQNMVETVAERMPSFFIIAMEICPQEMTGSARIQDNNIFVEVAYGSYVPKGVVPVSHLLLSKEGAVLEQEMLHQGIAIEIRDGKPTEVKVEKPPRLTQPILEQIRRITERISSEKDGAVIEFGITPNERVFLIDITHDKTEIPANRAVISHGKITGKVIRLSSEDFQKEALDAHFHSHRETNYNLDFEEPLIYVVENMFLTLEQIIIKSNPFALGFIFKYGSLLNHLAVLLREQGIPAVIADAVDYDELSNDEIISINTLDNTRALISRKTN